MQQNSIHTHQTRRHLTIDCFRLLLSGQCEPGNRRAIRKNRVRQYALRSPRVLRDGDDAHRRGDERVVQDAHFRRE